MSSKGFFQAIAAYVAWGFLPVYWKWLKAVPVLQLLSHRVAWSFVLLIAVLLFTKKWSDFRASAASPRVLATYFLAALLIGINWLTYVWAVSADFIVEASLGYFISPLLNVMLGVFVFRERLRPLQWLPVALAAAGVAYLTITYGRLPWIALTLASSFGVYGLVKKMASLDSVYGLTLETGALFLPSLAYLLVAEANGSGAFGHSGPVVALLLVGAGVTTTVPLVLFASAARSVPLSAIGILQYIAPSLQFLLGVLVYHEAFTATRAVGFGAVWLALVVFYVEARLARRSVAAPPAPEVG